MKSTILFRLSLPVAVLSGLWSMGSVLGADHKTPLTSTPKRVYPSGANISQRFEMPDPGTPAMVDASAAPGHVSASAAMHSLLAQPRNRARVQKQLTPVLRSQARMQFGAVNGAGPGGPAQAPSVTRFSYGYHYKETSRSGGTAASRR